MKILLLICLSVTCFAQSHDTASLLFKNSNGGTLSWNSGNHNQYIRGDGYLDTRMILVSGSPSATVVTGTTAETNVCNVQVPAGVMNANSVIRVFVMWKFTGTNGTRLTAIRLDTVSARTQGWIISPAAVLSGPALTGYTDIKIFNAGSLTSQNTGVCAAFNGCNPGIATSSINTANSFYIEFSITLASASDSAQLIGLIIELLNP